MSFYDLNNLKAQEITPHYLRRVATGENITLAKVEVRKGSITQPHSHDNEEVVVVLNGAWNFHLPQGDVTVGPNQMLIIPPGVEHSSEALADTVALDICTDKRPDWLMDDDEHLHDDPDQFLWAV